MAHLTCTYIRLRYRKYFYGHRFWIKIMKFESGLMHYFTFSRIALSQPIFRASWWMIHKAVSEILPLIHIIIQLYPYYYSNLTLHSSFILQVRKGYIHAHSRAITAKPSQRAAGENILESVNTYKLYTYIHITRRDPYFPSKPDRTPTAPRENRSPRA